MKLVILALLLPAIITATSPCNKKDWNHLTHRMFRHYSQIKNRRNNEKCIDVDFPMLDDGKVNVLAFVDPIWRLSNRQLSKFSNLVHRLEKKNIPGTHFFVITKYNHSKKTNHDTTIDRLKQTIPDNITVIEDNPEVQIWSKMKASRNQVFVLDHCGKLMYKFIVYMGIPRLHHLERAISSADAKPCGKCLRNSAALDPNLESEPLEKIVEKHAILEKEDVSLPKKNSAEPVDSTIPEKDDANLQNGTEVSAPSVPETTRHFRKPLAQHGGMLGNPKKIPLKIKPVVEKPKEADTQLQKMLKEYDPVSLKIIMRAPHYHGTKDPKTKYDYMVFDLDDPSYHGHMNDYSTNSAEVTNNFQFPMHPERADANNIVFDEDFNTDADYDDEGSYDWSRISTGPYDNKVHVTKKRKLDDFLDYYTENEGVEKLPTIEE